MAGGEGAGTRSCEGAPNPKRHSAQRVTRKVLLQKGARNHTCNAHRATMGLQRRGGGNSTHTTETTKHTNTRVFFAARSRLRTRDHAPHAGSSRFLYSSHSYAIRPAIRTNRTNSSCRMRKTGMFLQRQARSKRRERRKRA